MIPQWLTTQQGQVLIAQVEIMLQVENDRNACKIERYEDDVVLKHLELLEEAGLLKASFTRVEQAGIIHARVERLTLHYTTF